MGEAKRKKQIVEPVSDELDKAPEDDLDAYMIHAKEEMFPKMKQSAMSLILHHAEPDPKLAMELGAAILYDKPIIVLVTRNEVVPPTLARIANAIITGDPTDPDVQERLQRAMRDVIANDPRAKPV